MQLLALQHVDEFHLPLEGADKVRALLLENTNSGLGCIDARTLGLAVALFVALHVGHLLLEASECFGCAF